jgi:hypothetical protein
LIHIRTFKTLSKMHRKIVKRTRLLCHTRISPKDLHMDLFYSFKDSFFNFKKLQ